MRKAFWGAALVAGLTLRAGPAGAWYCLCSGIYTWGAGADDPALCAQRCSAQKPAGGLCVCQMQVMWGSMTNNVQPTGAFACPDCADNDACKEKCPTAQCSVLGPAPNACYGPFSRLKGAGAYDLGGGQGGIPTAFFRACDLKNSPDCGGLLPYYQNAASSFICNWIKSMQRLGNQSLQLGSCEAPAPAPPPAVPPAIPAPAAPLPSQNELSRRGQEDWLQIQAIIERINQRQPAVPTANELFQMKFIARDLGDASRPGSTLLDQKNGQFILGYLEGYERNAQGQTR